MELAVPGPGESSLRQELLELLASDGAGGELTEALSSLFSRYPGLLKRSLAKIKQRHVIRDIVGHPAKLLPLLPLEPPVAPEFKDCGFSAASLQYLVRHYDFKTVLDVGSGAGKHARALSACGKVVTKLDFGVSYYFKQEIDGTTTIVADVNLIEMPDQYDCVWASHVLEHQKNVGIFLGKLKSFLRPNGVLCITVPPLKFDLVGGHLSLWTPGHLIYNLVMAGFDCSEAEIFHYGYNISVFLRNIDARLPQLHFDTGDIKRLKKFFPREYAEGMDASIATSGTINV